MILLDTDHFSVLRYNEHPRCAELTSRLLTCGDPRVATTVVTLEEQLRGWLSEIHRCRKSRDLIPLYDRLASIVEFFRRWEVVRFDDVAAAEFDRIRRLTIGTQDLRIAAIAKANGALLLSANLRDFGKVPGLRVESWLD